MRDISEKKWEIQGRKGEHSSLEIYRELWQEKLQSDDEIREYGSSKDWQRILKDFSLIKKYGLLKKLGSGGFGEVYLAVDLERYVSTKGKNYLVALKRPLDAKLLDFAQQQGIEGGEKEQIQWAKREIGQVFSKEALNTARLSSCENVISVLDHDISEPHLVLEYCNEGTLQHRIRNKGYGVKEILSWGYQMAKGLEAAHALEPQQMIHRDLKPQNILLHEGKIKICDWGSAEMRYHSQSLRSESEYTPLYAAPEAFEGKAYAKTDVWSWGVIMYQLIAGDLPFDGNLGELMGKIQRGRYRPLQERNTMQMAKEVCKLVERCLLQRVEKRPTAQECREILEGIISERKPEPVPVRRLKWRYGMILAMLVVAITLGWMSIPSEKEIISRKIQVAIESGNLCMEKQQYSDAIEQYRMALALDPQSQIVQEKLQTAKKKEEEKRKTLVKLELEPKEVILQPGEKQKFVLRGYNGYGEKLAISEKDQEVEHRGGRLEKWEFTAGDEAGEYEISVVLGSLKVQAKITITPFGGKIGLECWNEKEGYFDFTAAIWEKLGFEEQKRYAGEYQNWYAEKVGKIVEKEVQVGNTKMVMVLIPPGKYWMGSPESEAGRDSDEYRHQVLISKGFWIGKYEVTQKQWREVMGSNPAYFKKAGENAPVEGVSWNDCQEFCKKTGLSLPTEGQWEYAGRAGTLSTYNWGNWEKGKSNSASYWAKRDLMTYEDWSGFGFVNKWKDLGAGTLPVGQFGSNNWGLHDMHGNVWEWCNDWYDAGYYKGSVNGVMKDPLGPSNGSLRCRRGGGWYNYAGYLRAADRSRNSPDFSNNSIGLRAATILEKF